MTNTDSVLDTPREEVQLTELRPVEQSFIKPAIEGNCNDTDGLRVLRSYTHRQVDELEQFGSGYSRRRRSERWKHIKSSTNEFGLNSDEDVDEEEACVEKLSSKNSKYTIDNSLHSDEFEDVDEVDEDEDDDEFYGDPGDFDYLDGKYSSEIYVYRGSNSSPTVAEEAKNDLTPKEKDIVPKPQLDSLKPSHVEVYKPRRRGRPRKNSFTEKSEEHPKKVKATPEQSEKELQNRINEIIQENLLMEQDNNNIVEDIDKTRKQKINLNSDTKNYSCKICKASFKGSGGLRNHHKVAHENGPYYKCDECGKEFPLKERLKLHLRIHTGFKPYKCQECDKSFARSGQLVQHRRTHSHVKPYSCELCSGTFTCAANLTLHIKRHYGQKDHKCNVCGRGFVRRDALKKHLECLHKDVKSFLCTICNKTFKGHLPQHMRTHAQDRPHGCATCGQRFAQKSQLTVHQRTHSGQRPFRCLVCWQAFAHSTALKLHTRRHTGERPFKCAECNAGFTQLPHWKKHMKCIHGRIDPYCCRNCNSFFRIKNDLEAHEKDCLAEPKTYEEATDGCSPSALARFRTMTIEKIRLLLAVLLKRISKPERLEELGFGKRLIDEVLIDSLVFAGKNPVKADDDVPEFEALKKNLAIFLEWTVPKEHWDTFRKMQKTPEEVLETLTAT